MKRTHLLLALCALAPAVVHAARIDANPSNYRTLLASLNPGDTLVLAPGTYGTGLPITNMQGTSALPIAIEGPADQSAVFHARDCCNTVQLDSSSYIVIRNLTLDGLDLSGPFGVDSRGPCHDITLENLRIVNHGENQAVVGISTKGPAWNWIIRRNTIVGAGTGMYLGSSDGTLPFVAGVIEHNLIVDTVGYNIEIKHQVPRPTGIGMPTGDSRTIIRHNVFSKANGASTGGDARPNLLVGHFPLSGAGQNDRYEIYGNFFWQNPSEALFQGEGHLALYDNLFVNASGDAINIQPHNSVPRNVAVFHNTVVATGTGIRVSGADSGFVQRIVGNAVFAATPVSGPNAVGNVTGTRAQASTALVAPTAPIDGVDLFPRAGQLSGTALDLTPFAAFTDSGRDFNGRARAGNYRGAYDGEGTNPGWKLALATKPASGSAPAPTVSLGATPSQVQLQGSTTLAWSSAQVVSCNASGGWSGAKATSGSETVGPIAANTAYALTCTGPSGSASASAQVTVVTGAPAPTLSLSASPGQISPGASTLLAWQATNASACVASGGWSGARATSGSESIGNLQSSTTFTLQCTGAGGSVLQSASVVVSGSTPNPPPTAPVESGSGGGRVPLPILMVLAGVIAGRFVRSARTGAR
jgi:hypothetical protein